jgi:hypothetical protein
MLNQVVLIGQVVAINKGSVLDHITVSIQQPSKEDHRVKVVVPHALLNILDTITIPSIIAIKARLSCYEDLLEVIAERISVLNNGASK